MGLDHGKKEKVLIVDDMLATRKIVTNMLKSFKFENIESCEDGQIAWEMIEKAHSEGSGYRLVISDWNMPKLTGLELLQKIRSDERFKDILFLMVSSESQLENIEAAVKAGVSSYIVKPFDATSFQEILAKIFRKA